MSAPHQSPPPPARLSHAGGIVYRPHGDDLEVLLIRAKPAPHDWVFPKGHIEHGERAEDCAIREVREEAGVDAHLESLLGYDSYVTPQGKRVCAVFFLMRFAGPAPTDESRECAWLSLDDAEATLRFEGARRILAEAARQVRSR